MAFALRLIFWLGAGAIAILLLTQPVSVQAQSALGLSVLLLMAAVWIFLHGPLARQIFLALGSFIAIRYIYWRATDTLPPTSDISGFTLGMMLLLAEIYCFIVMGVNLVIGADPLRRKPLPRDKDEDLPMVDVFIPTYNEDEYILATTIAAAMSMEYPDAKLNVYLLDDGGTDQKCNDLNSQRATAARIRRASLQNLCAQMGATYLTRARNEHAKAGNLNAALNHTNGEIIVVLDADHVPFRAFLRETIGYFRRDPKLFLVQTPHVFLNPDPIEKNLRTFNEMPSENEMFYSITQRGLDKWDGSYFCGSAALIRRAALRTTGGFSGVTITEDCETAFELHGNGWHSVFVDKPLIAGLQPETFASFIGQRSRWAQGMLQILILKNPLFKKGLKPIQKLAYLSSMTFWFFPLPRMIFLLAPLCYIFFDIKIFVANVNEAIAYTAIYMTTNMMMQNYLYGKVRWPWVSELYEFVQGVFLAKALVEVVVSPHKPTFNVTAKGQASDDDRLSELSWPFFAIWGLLLAGAFTAAYRYMFDPGANSLMLVVGVWNGFNLLIAGAALGAVAERKQPDRHPRLNIDREGTVVVDSKLYPVKIGNVSAGGCAFTFLVEPPHQFDSAAIFGRLFVKPLPGAVVQGMSLPLKFKRGRTVHGAATVGAKFEALHPREYYVLAELMYGDSQALPRFLKARRKHKNLWAGTLTFIWWGLSEPLRALRYAMKAAPEAEKPDHAPEPAIAAALVGAGFDFETDIADASNGKPRRMFEPAVAHLHESKQASGRRN